MTGDAAWASTPPGFAVDLGLDAIARALDDAAGVPGLGALLYAPLPDADAVAYRHEVARDLEPASRVAAATAFVDAMRDAGAAAALAGRTVHPLQRARRRLDAELGCRAAVEALAGALAHAGGEAPGDADRTDAGGESTADGDRATTAALRSRALLGVASALGDLVASAPWRARGRSLGAVADSLDAVRYRLRITEHRVTVLRPSDEADDGAAVAATFARFRDGAAPPAGRADPFTTDDMNAVEAGVVERVARLHPDAFRGLLEATAAGDPLPDPGLAGLARELAWFLAWRTVLEPLRAAGLATCLPGVGGAGSALVAAGAFDLALALRRVAAGERVVPSDVALREGEWLAVVTGPTHGGKTSLARAIGQVAHLAAAGCPVPAASARVPLVDAVHAHFDRPEDPGDLAGRLEAELRRLRAILAVVTGRSLVVLNESLASTTADDAVALWRVVLAELHERGARAVAVTALAELASFDEATVSLVLGTDEAGTGRPTYRAERRPADGLLHARRLLDRHGLGYDAVRARLAR